MSLFDMLDNASGTRIMRSPLNYPGSKLHMVNNILPHLPHRARYVEPFAGSFIVGLNRQMAAEEVLNDRHSGLIDFYLEAQRDADGLFTVCSNMLHSPQVFADAKETWATDYSRQKRAAKWFYLVNTSYHGVGRNWCAAMLRTLRTKDQYIKSLGARLRRTIIENLDWRDCIRKYDSPDTVFYMDPPYVDANPVYKHEMGAEDHRELLQSISETQGFVALSGTDNPIFESIKWDEAYSWRVKHTIDNHPEEEMLWIKHAVSA